MSRPAYRCSLQGPLRTVALLSLLIAGTHPVRAAQPPDAPTPPVSTPTAPTVPVAPAAPTPLATVSGTLTDSDGNAIAGARIVLNGDNRNPPLTSSPSNASPESPSSINAITSSDGSFTFPNLPPGPFHISIEADGFMAQEVSGTLQPGEIRLLPAIAMSAGSSSSIRVTANQSDIAQAQIGEEEKQRVLGVIPNFYVSYIPNPVPLTPRQKFQLAIRSMIDPVNFAIIGAIAGVEQANDTYAWGEGAQGYAKRYAANYGTFLTGSLIGNAALPILFKQDPRYFYKGTGSIRSRALYAIANAVICKGDNHRWQFNYSSVLGGLAASGISNAYYPAPDRTGLALTVEGAAIGTAETAISNLFQEFVIRRLTPHIPANPPAESASH